MIKKSKIAFLYALAISTVIGLIIGNQIFASNLLSSSEEDANVINLAGRQRMLSQKIALDSYKSISDFSHFKKVKATTEDWVFYHKALRNGNSSLNIPYHDSDELRTMFKKIDSNVDVVDRLVAGVNSADELEVFIELITKETSQYLPQMESIVQQIQVEAEERHARLEFFEILMTILSILILGAVFVFILRPVINELDLQNKRLKRVNLSKDRIMSTIAHDLRSPINGIKGMLELIREELEDHLESSQKTMFDLADDSFVKINGLIQEILDVSLFESDDFEIHRERILLKEYLQNNITHFKDIARKKGVELAVNVEKDVLAVDIDQRRFGRVIDNLLTNALKFTPTQGKVLLESYEKDETVIVKVKDTGIGIPKDKQEYIFDKFSIARREGLEGEETTGLGMSIVKQIVELHEGKIWVESIEHVGTEFFIELPKVA